MVNSGDISQVGGRHAEYHKSLLFQVGIFAFAPLFGGLNLKAFPVKQREAMGVIALPIVNFPSFKGVFMKTAKHHQPHHTPLPTEIRFRPDVEYSARESRLIHQIARNLPAENRRLGKEIVRQRRPLRHALGVVRRYARSITRLSLPEQRAIRQLQDSPFYVGLGAAVALRRDDSDEMNDVDDFDWLFDDEKAGYV
jgi:hypothetical protein